MPSAFDVKVVFETAPQHELSKNDKDLVDAWANAVKPDPRSRAASSSASTSTEQVPSPAKTVDFSREFAISTSGEHARAQPSWAYLSLSPGCIAR